MWATPGIQSKSVEPGPARAESFSNLCSCEVSWLVVQAAVQPARCSSGRPVCAAVQGFGSAHECSALHLESTFDEAGPLSWE